MLGIVIGVGAVIALVSFGQGVEKYVKERFQSLGSNLLFAFSSVPQGGNPADAKPMTMADAEAIANPLYAPSVVRAASEYAVFAIVVTGRNDTAISISRAALRMRCIPSGCGMPALEMSRVIEAKAFVAASARRP